MDFSVHIDTLSMGVPIVYFMGSQIELKNCLNYDVFVSLKVVFILANSEDPIEMKHFNAACHLGLHCLPKSPI